MSELGTTIASAMDYPVFPGQDRASLMQQLTVVEEVVEGLGAEEFSKLFIDAHLGADPAFIIDPNEFLAVGLLFYGDKSVEFNKMQEDFHAAQKAMFLQFYRENMARMGVKVIARAVGTGLREEGEVSPAVWAPIAEKWRLQKEAKIAAEK